MSSAAMNHLKPPFLVINFGAPGSGKTHLTKYIAYCLVKKQLVKCIHVFCGTASFEDEYNWLEKDAIHTNPKNWEEETKKILETQKRNERFKRENILIIYDDWTGKIHWDKGLYSQMITDFRHLNISLVVNTHYANKVPTLMREAAFNAGIFEQISKRSLDSLYEVFGQAAFENYKAFRDYIVQHTDRNKKIFIWYTRSPLEGQSRFQPVKCPAVPEFRVFNNKKRTREEGEGSEPEIEGEGSFE